MLRVVEIVDKKDFSLLCKFNNGELRRLNILPIIENHKHINGVELILESQVFAKVQIGQFGEIVWQNIVRTNKNGENALWDYDISPEYAFYNSKQV